VTTTLPAPPGDQSYLASYLVGTYLFGSVIPPDQATNAPFSGTYEIYGDIGSMVFPAVVGPQGIPGPSAFALHLMTDATVDSPADLPQTLQNVPADIGKFWLLDDIAANGDIIGSSAYVWYGTAWRRVMLGTPGPPGPVPIITPTVDLIPPGQSSYIDPIGGTPLEPTWNMNLAVPPGPTGPAPALALCPDVDLLTNPPVPGDLLGTLGRSVTMHLAPPNGLQLVSTSSGGSLSGPHYWMVTSFSDAGESTGSNEVNAVMGASTIAHLAWPVVPGAAGYKLYRGTAAGAENVLVATINNPNTNSYADTGAAGTTASPPGSNTAAVTYVIWEPVSVSQLMPSVYSMPEAAFTSQSGLSQRIAIGSFVIPPQPFPWTPVCWGHIGAFGVELSANPMMVGCEILLGDPSNGTLISRGFGNTLGEVNIMPHYSNPTNPGVAITPTNGIGAVPANHSSPAEGTIYVNLYNDGAVGLYSFSPTDAQVAVMVMPLSEPIALSSGVQATRRLPSRATRRR
jgi:hypothetical protein